MVKRTAWLGATILLATFLAEIGLRLGAGLGDPPLFQRDDEIGYLMAPGQEVFRLGNRIAINRFHQRSEEVSVDPVPETTRILFVGDSITFGISAVDQSETYPEIVAENLRKKGHLVEALNASAISWGIGNERAYVERFGTFGSRVAVLQIGSADLLQPTSTSEAVGIHPAYPDRKPLTAMGELLFRYILPRVTILRFGTLEEEPVSKADRDRQFSKNMHEFKELVADISLRGTLPVILLIPGLAELITGPSSLDRYEPYRKRFIELVGDLSLPLIDIASLWNGDPHLAEYYYDGTHLTAKGNAALAHIIVDALMMQTDSESEGAVGAMLDFQQ